MKNKLIHEYFHKAGSINKAPNLIEKNPPQNELTATRLEHYYRY